MCLEQKDGEGVEGEVNEGTRRMCDERTKALADHAVPRWTVDRVKFLTDQPQQQLTSIRRRMIQLTAKLNVTTWRKNQCYK